MERPGDCSQMRQRQPQSQGQSQLRSQIGLAVEMPIEPSTPLFVEFDAGDDFVAGLEGWRQTRLKGALAEQAAGERMESADIRLIQVGDPLGDKGCARVRNVHRRPMPPQGSTGRGLSVRRLRLP